MTQPLDPTLLSRLKALHEKHLSSDGINSDCHQGLCDAFPQLLAHIEAQDGRIKAQHDRIEEISESALKMREVLHQAGYEWVMNYGWAKKTHTEAK